MSNNTTINQHDVKSRNISLDILRVMAIFFVLFQHSSEYYYIGDNLSIQVDNSYTIGWINSLSRICIGLFVMISGYLLLPVKTTTKEFFSRRFVRILAPFITWCVAYAVYYVFYRGDSITDCFTHILSIPVNWGVEVGHLWYIYMLVGLYLLAPVLSPWLRSCSKGELQFYLAIWVVTTVLPYLHMLTPGILGEASWNVSPLLYYFTGFVGYFLLGHYIKRYGSLSTLFSCLLLVVGYVLSVLAFNGRIQTATGVVDLEIGWDFCSINVAMMTVGVFSLVNKLKVSEKKDWTKVIVDISMCSYAMYLVHIMLLNFYHDLLDSSISSLLIKVPAIAIATFVTTYLIVKLLSYLPKEKYWLGV